MGVFELDAVDSVLVLEETGRGCVPEPVVEAWACESPDATLALDNTPFALYADSAGVVIAQRGDALVHASVDGRRPSVDGSRRLFVVRADCDVLDLALARVRDRTACAAV